MAFVCRASIAVWRTALGVALGIGFVLVTERYLEHDHKHAMGSLRGEDARKALLIVGVMTVHSAAEGIGVGAAFADGSTLGLLITIAIAVHNIPEGLAISLVLVPRGSSVSAAAGWSIFSSLPQPLLAVPAFLLVENFTSILPSRWDSRPVQWCGWCSGSCSPRRSKRLRRGSSPSPAVPHLRSCSAFSSCCPSATAADTDPGTGDVRNVAHPRVLLTDGCRRF